MPSQSSPSRVVKPLFLSPVLKFTSLFALVGVVGTHPSVAAESGRTTISIQSPGKAISPDLIGVFFEDINYAADGGLYAELVQNRSFEYSATEQTSWTPLTAWELVQRDGGKGSLKVSDAVLVHPNNPHYAVLEMEQPGGAVHSSFLSGRQPAAC